MKDQNEYHRVWRLKNHAARLAYERAWRAKNRGKVRLYGREATRRKRSTPEGRQQSVEAQRKWRANNLEWARERERLWREKNREKLRIEGREKYWRDPDAFRLKAKRRQARQYEELRNAVGKHREYPTPTHPIPSHCECCGIERTARTLGIDHCHVTGAFRGWICGKCNRGIGLLGDSLAGVQRAVSYLTHGNKCSQSGIPPEIL